MLAHVYALFFVALARYCFMCRTSSPVLTTLGAEMAAVAAAVVVLVEPKVAMGAVATRPKATCGHVGSVARYCDVSAGYWYVFVALRDVCATKRSF